MNELAMAILAVPAFSQTATVTISGRGGAVIVGATVEMHSIERGTLRSAPTNGVGLCVFPSVERGHTTTSRSEKRVSSKARYETCRSRSVAKPA